MPHDYQFLQKLWDKGIDISASVITSVIIGLIGLAFWRVKLGLDLRADERKQRQQNRIKEELESTYQVREKARKRAKLAERLKGFQTSAEAMADDDSAQHSELFKRFIAFISEPEMAPHNTHILSQNWVNAPIRSLHQELPEVKQQVRASIIRAIRSAELPPGE